jgi:hypothetical protein
MQAGQCGRQIGTKVLEVVSNENGIGGDGEYCGNSDAKLDRINAFYHEASGGSLLGALRPRARRDRRCALVAARRALPKW